MVTFLILLLFAVIFLVAGIALLYFRNKNKQKAALMGQTETSEAPPMSRGSRRARSSRSRGRCGAGSRCPARWSARSAPTTPPK